MAESIRFDFLSTGAEKLARDFKNTGNNAAAAARGAAVLQDIIGKLGQKEERTAAQSALLARALRQTGDAEDRAAARAVAADAAIRRLDDAMQKEERDALEAAAANRLLGDSFGKLAEKAGPSGLRGALAALTPALIPLSAGLTAGVAAVGVSFGAAAAGAGLFGALAKSVFSNVSKDNQKLQTAQKQLAAAQIARSQATTKAQRQAADKQIAAAQNTIAAIRSEGAAYNQVLDLSREVATRWKVASAQIASPALVPWLQAVSKGISFLRPAVQPVADEFKSWGQAVDRYFTSAKGSAEVTRLAAAFGRFSADQLSAIGVFVTDIGKGVFSLGRDLAAHNIDFGAFSVHLDQWGGAFLRWSQSASARHDVSTFLAYVRANGPVIKDLLKNLGADLKVFAPGLTGVGQLELKLVSDFLGFLARTPKSIARPLTETAGALLLLQKTGVLKVGIKVTGAAVKWLTKGAIDIGGGAAAGAEIRAAFASGGAAAAAEIRAALAGAAAPGAGGAAAGAGGAAAGGLSGAFAAAGVVAAGVFAGAFIRGLGDKLSPKGTAAGNLNRNLQQLGTGASTSLLHSFTFGGLESWLATKFGIPVGGFINNTLNFLGRRTRTVTGQAGSDVGGMADVWQQKMAMVKAASERALAAAGVASDNLRTRNLTPLRNKIGDVSGGIQGLQHQIDLLHGKNISVGAHLSGSGGVQVTPSTGAPGAKNYSVYFKPLAAGGRVFGGMEGRDSVPAMLMPGEVVVPTAMVKAGAVDHLRGALPGFASGGLVGNLAAGTGTDVAAEARANLAAIVASLKKAAQAAGGGVGSYKPGAGVRQWRGVVSQALRLAGSSQQLIDAVLYQMQTESGGNPYAVNKWDSNWLAGHPSVGLMQVIRGTFQAYAGRFRRTGPFAYGVSENPLANVYAAIRYAQANYGPGLRNAYGGIGTGRGYARGGLVPGYATGGTVASKGRAWLNAWQTKHGGGFGAAWGPVVVNEQIARMQAAIGRASSLASARGLSAGQHRFWAAAAADEKKRLAVLHSELTTERAWRYQLGLGELALDKEIRAAGSLPSLAGAVRGWKAQLGRDKATVAAISKMLGYSDAYLKAHPAATPPPKLPPVQHIYGGDVADTIAPILASALAPTVMDRGGWLRPGLTSVYNGTGRPEMVVPSGRSAGGGAAVILEVESSGTEFDQFLAAWLRKHTRIKGGGDVQVAWGSR